MTTQKTIEWLEAIEEKYIHGGDELFDQKRKIAISNAVEALEKQIPKKPTIKKSVKVNAFTLRCPNCEAVLQADSPCCRYCGQALDWSDA